MQRNKSREEQNHIHWCFRSIKLKEERQYFESFQHFKSRRNKKNQILILAYQDLKRLHVFSYNHKEAEAKYGKRN